MRIAHLILYLTQVILIKPGPGIEHRLWIELWCTAALIYVDDGQFAIAAIDAKVEIIYMQPIS